MHGLGQDARPQVFISHASHDKEATRLLVDLLSVGMGAEPDEIFCTSSPGADIPPGVGFFDYIRERLQRSALVVHLITPAFVKSEFCMLEIGAAWGQGKAFPILAPPLTLRDIESSALASLQLTLLDRDGLDKLRDRVGGALDVRMKTAGWADRRDRALRNLQEALDSNRQSQILRIAALGVRGHHLEVWGLTAKGRIYHSWWPADGGEEIWNKPYDFDAPGEIVDLAVGSRGPDHSEVFAVDNRGVLWHRWWSLKQSWSGWHVFGRAVAPPVAACSLQDGHIEVFCVDPPTNRVVHRWSSEPGVWSEWVPLDRGLDPG